jgi:hypothetical protein
MTWLDDLMTEMATRNYDGWAPGTDVPAPSPTDDGGYLVVEPPETP